MLNTGAGLETPYAYLVDLLPPWIAPYIKVASLLGVRPEIAYPAAVFVVGIALGASVTASVGKLRARRNERAQADQRQRDGLRLAVMAVCDELLGYGAVNVERVEAKLGDLESSEHPLWIAPKAWAARSDFLDHARRALNVRRTRDDYRNEIERGETALMMNDAGDRVTAALRSKAIPPAFNPFEDEPDPRVKQVWRRITRRWRGVRTKRRERQTD